MKNLKIFNTKNNTKLIKKDNRIINFKNSALREIIKNLNSLNLNDDIKESYLNYLNRFLEKEIFENVIYCFDNLCFYYQLALEYIDNSIKLRITFVDEVNAHETIYYLEDHTVIANLIYNNCVINNGPNEIIKVIDDMTSKSKAI